MEHSEHKNHIMDTEAVRPALQGIPVYEGTELVKTHEMARYGLYGLKMIGYVAYRGLEVTVNVLDEILQPNK